MTIRRDLRVAHSIIERSALMHAVTLYARWFKATSGQSKLDSQVFFESGTLMENHHKGIIELQKANKITTIVVNTK